MISLCILGALLVAIMACTGWTLAWAARAVGSQRGRFAVGVATAALLIALNVILSVGGSVIPVETRAAAIAIDVALAVMQLVVGFLIIRRVFALSIRRTFAPFAAMLVIGAIQITFMLLVFRPYLAESMTIPTESLEPTIKARSRVVVNKVISPRRLDFVVYWNHDPEPLVYCKRLVGLPGERIRFEGGGIFINDHEIDLPPAIAGRCHTSVPGWQEGPRYRDGETIALGDDEYFFIGDNLARSLDSRIVGPTKVASLIGVVDLVYWPWRMAAVLR